MIGDGQPDVGAPREQLELELERSRAASRELARRLEERTQELLTARAQVEAAERALRLQTPLTVLAESESFDEAAPRILESLCANLGFPIAALWRRDGRGDALSRREVWVSDGAPGEGAAAIGGAAITAIGAGLAGLAWVQRRAVWTTAPPGGVAASGAARAVCAFPLVARGEVVAVVELYASAVGEPDFTVLETLDGVGLQLGRAVERRLAQQDDRARDLAIARRIQATLLPKDAVVEGFDLLGCMVPAADIGGDYFDFLPCDDGCWIGVGDVAGHGLAAGLVVMMVQSGVAALVRANPSASPREHVVALNAMLHENIRRRMSSNEHVTFSLARLDRSGRMRLAGAHEDVLVARRSGGCDRVRTPGAWLGAVADISRVTVDVDVHLEPGDVALLYTDGLTEASNAGGELFGLDRLSAVVERLQAAPLPELRDGVLEAVRAFAVAQDDDRTIVLVRRR